MCAFCSYFNTPMVAARNHTEMALEKHGVGGDLWSDILCSAGAIEAVYWNRFEQVVDVLQKANVAHGEWPGILCTSGAVEAIYANNLPALAATLVKAAVADFFWAKILRARAMSAAIEQDCFSHVVAAMAAVPVPLWAEILQSKGAQQAIYRGNFVRVTEALACVSPELWTAIMESNGFAESVAQDDLRQVTSALEHVSAHLWAGILNTNGAFEHVLSQWADDNPMGLPNRGNAQDPLIGAHNRPGATFDIPQDHGKRFDLDGFTPFVRTVGTLYAFFPGLKAVKFMATGWGRRKAD
jgi:hypothetical protein